LYSCVPRLCYEFLRDRKFSVEAFSSPIGVVLSDYYSLDVEDNEFGSRGNFFSSTEIVGRWVANPPFLDEFMIEMIKHMRFLFSGARRDKEFVFLLIIPAPYSGSSKNIHEELMSLPWHRGVLDIEADQILYDQYLKSPLKIGMRHRHVIKCDTVLHVFSNTVMMESDSFPSFLEQFAENWRKISEHREELEFDSCIEHL